MNIRLAEEADAGQLVELMSSLASGSSFLMYEYDEVPSSTMFAKRMSSTKISELIWVTEFNDKFVGYLALTLSTLKRNHGVATLAMGVRNHCAYNGVGSGLMSTAISEARKIGVYRLQLHVQTTNERAIKLYRKFGYEVEGTLRNAARVNGQLVDKYTMAKLL